MVFQRERGGNLVNDKNETDFLTLYDWIIVPFGFFKYKI